MQNNPIQSSEQLINRAISIAESGRLKTVVVAAAQDADVLDAVVQAKVDNYILPILVGDKSKILTLTEENMLDISDIEIIDKPDVIDAARTAIQLAADGNADAVMKGFLPTSSLLKTVLDSKYNLRGSAILSHCAVLDIPGYHKLLNLTDGGMVVQPDLQQKKNIIENAILVSQALAISPLKIAVSAPYEKVYANQQHVKEDIENLVPFVQQKYSEILIQAAVPFDTAVSNDFHSNSSDNKTVVGDADIFLANSIEECNIIAKTLINFAQAVFSGVIVGAKVPVSLVSRSDTVMNKKSSLALSVLMADYYQQNNIWGEK